MTRSRSQSGMSLIEILVGIVVMVVIVVPLSAAFVSMLRSSGAAQERFDRSGEIQKINEAWTRDVQSVDPRGVNTPAGQHCGINWPSVSTNDDGTGHMPVPHPATRAGLTQMRNGRARRLAKVSVSS